MNPSQQELNDGLPGRAERVSGLRKTPTGFEQRLLTRARETGFGRGDRLVVAFSGGRDSLALAAALRRVRDALDINLLLVYVDHRLRSESGEEAVRAAGLAEALGLKFRSLATEAMPHEIHPGIGIEEAARRERYRLLFEAAGDMGARAVVTGHHQQDQAETVLMHLLRGGGVHGAVGMSERTAAPIPMPMLEAEAASDISREHFKPWLWRPLLQEPRAAIDAYVGLARLDWIEDSSNADLALRRNVVRGRIIPILETEFPGASAALARYATLAAADDEALELIAQAAMEGQIDLGGRLATAIFRDRPLGVQRRMIRRWFSNRTGWWELSADRTDAILGLCSPGRGNRTIEAGGGWTVSEHKGMLRARRNVAEERNNT
jgi:tRNA(Ile)-lysidine synthase